MEHVVCILCKGYPTQSNREAKGSSHSEALREPVGVWSIWKTAHTIPGKERFLCYTSNLGSFLRFVFARGATWWSSGPDPRQGPLHLAVTLRGLLSGRVLGRVPGDRVCTGWLRKRDRTCPPRLHSCVPPPICGTNCWICPSCHGPARGSSAGLELAPSAALSDGSEDSDTGPAVRKDWNAKQGRFFSLFF